MSNGPCSCAMISLLLVLCYDSLFLVLVLFALCFTRFLLTFADVSLSRLVIQMIVEFYSDESSTSDV